MLSVRDATVQIENKIVLSGFNLEIGEGEVHVLMGVNGSGKSSLANVLMGNNNYVVERGRVEFEGQDLFKLSIDERARAGIYGAWQNPMTIPGVSVFSLCKALRQAQGKLDEFKNLIEFKRYLEKLAVGIGLTKEHVRRNVNDGFSGGEKKRLELLQLLLLKPKLAILDEIDSGLDADGIRIVRKIVQKMKDGGTSFLIITHNTELLEKIVVTKIWKITN